MLERYQRRTARLTRQIKAVVKELAGRAGARLLAILAAGVSRHTALRAPTERVPRVIGVDDFALRRRHRYATVVIDAETHKRIDVLPDRTADTLEAWLREHPGVEIVCRDGSATYAEAIRRALPDAVQVADRWHVWHNLCDAALSEVKAHSSCWATVLDAPLYDGPRARTTLERWHQVHDLLDQGVDLRDVLTGVFPALERAFDYSAHKGALVLLTGYQTPAAIRRRGRARLTAWLANRSVRNADAVAATALQAAEAQDTVLPGEDVAARIVADLAEQILTLNDDPAGLFGGGSVHEEGQQFDRGSRGTRPSGPDGSHEYRQRWAP